MSDPTQNLSEISHLFLSGVRDLAQTGSPRPTRIPPPKQPAHSIDMTPEEFAAAQRGLQPTSSLGSGKDARKIGPVAAVLASHFGDALHDQVKAYARHLAHHHNQRVGILELDASLLRLYSVERTLGSDAGAPAAEPAAFEAHQLAEALDEMNWDIDRWLVLVPNPRLPEAKSLLKNVGHWILLTNADHEGMVAAYRGLKGLADNHRPRLSLAVLDSDKSEAERIHHKLAGVCAQFLNWPLAADFTHVTPAPPHIQAHAVLAWTPTHDKAQLATNPHWKVAGDFLHKAHAHVIDDSPALSPEEAAFVDQPDAPAPAPSPSHDRAPLPGGRTSASAVAQPAPHIAAASDVAETPAVLHKITPAVTPMPIPDSASEVLDLPDNDPSHILPTLLSNSNGQLLECPVQVPMCPEAKLALTRDRRLTLLAVASHGLSDLRTISQAYRWLIENRPLLSMALPQLAIDPHAHPQLRLLVNHADLSADLLQPLLQSSSVTVQSYRTLRWGAKTGLLLEAA